MLQAERLLVDPRIKESKELLLAAVSQHCQSLSGVRPSQAEFRHSYQSAIDLLAELRGAKLLLPYLGSGIGCGPLVELSDGSVKYDFIGGIGVHFFGHAHPMLINAAIDAALSDLPMQGNLIQNRDALEFMDALVKAVGLPHCFLTTSGAMAIENALKIAWQKHFPASRILAFARGFAGRSLATAQITDKASNRVGLPTALSVDYVPFYDPEYPEESTVAALEAIKQAISRYPQGHAAMIFELVQGEGGVYPGSKEFFTSLMSLLKENNIAVIVDEVQTFGRTEQLLAFQYFELASYVDICTIGKLSLVCATLFSDNYIPKPGLLSQTFTSSTAAIRLGKVVLDMLLNGTFYGSTGKIAQQSQRFIAGLEAISQRHPGAISGPYGLGAMIAFTPGDGSEAAAWKVIHDLYDAGVISFICGAHPARIRFLPPMGALTFGHIDEVLAILEATLQSIHN